MREFSVVYCNSKLHGHPPCWRVWARTWGWYIQSEFATKEAADAEAALRNLAWEHSHKR